MSQAHKVRGRHGLLPCKSLEYHGFSVQAIKEWRAVEFDAGRGSGMDDFYAAHGLCFDCLSEGVRVTGSSKPVGAREVKRADAFGLEKLPVYEICATCGGSGKADRSQWKR